MGLLAQTNVSIREAEIRYRESKAREERVRRPIATIDRLIQDLEELNLRGHKRVPLTFEARLRDLLRVLPSLPELAAQIDNLKVKIGIGKLMDSLFAIEEALFVERKGPSADPDGEDRANEFTYAA